MKRLQRPLPRHLTGAILKSLSVFPVVILTGARQTGKSTLIRDLLPGGHRLYRTLDDLEVLQKTRMEPDALLSSREPLTLDEVQRGPELLLAIKGAVDRDREPGRFLLSGSANLALLQSVSETLAGRATYLVLHPFTTAESAGLGRAGNWETLLDDPSPLEGDHPPLVKIHDLLLAGGLPPAVLADAAAERSAWLDGYVKTYLERDLQQLSGIANLVDFRRLMRAAALRTGAILNQSELARDVGLPAPTAHRYLNLLEASHLLLRLPAYAVHRTRRLVKSPRLYLCDTGLAAHLAGVETAQDLERTGLRGPLLEALVLGDFLSWREGRTPRPEILYWRTASGAEVDFVIETAGRLIPIEVKANPTPRLEDARHLALFLEEYGDAAPRGIVLHTGTRCEPLTAKVWAVPLGAVLGIEGA